MIEGNLEVKLLTTWTDAATVVRVVEEERSEWSGKEKE